MRAAYPSVSGRGGSSWNQPAQPDYCHHGTCIPGNVRLIRSVVLTVADQDYVEAARSYGTSNARIIFRYVLPNAMGPIIVNTTMAISDMILSAAGLSFIGMVFSRLLRSGVPCCPRAAVSCLQQRIFWSFQVFSSFCLLWPLTW